MILTKWSSCVCIIAVVILSCNVESVVNNQEDEGNLPSQPAHSVGQAASECDKDKCKRSVCKCCPGYGLDEKRTWLGSDTCKKCDCGKEFNCTISTGIFRTKTCLCPDGYSEVDKFCKADCKKNPCKNDGECVVKGTDIECKCAATFTGEFCEKKNTNPCSPNPCTNKGKCSVKQGKVNCSCSERYNGTFCELDKCANVKCENKGLCDFVKGKQVCNCTDRYEGVKCEKDKCANVECLHKGVCDFVKKQQVCNCTERYEGKMCEKDKCEKVECLNGGKCDYIKKKQVCNCTDRYEGEKCEKDKCAKVKCLNGGTCDFIKKKQVCNCTDRYEGEKCEKDKCAGVCKNGGICDFVKGEFICKCQEGFYGKKCETECKCENGRCTEKMGKLTCICKPEFGLYEKGVCKACKCGKGANCTFDPDLILENKKCLCPKGMLVESGKCVECKCENGKCQEVNGVYSCICNPEFGLYKKGVCKACDCGPGANCTFDDGFFSDKTCVCPKGWVHHEKKCVDVCTPNPCQHNGTCDRTTGKANCTCKDPYTGDMCEKELTTGVSTTSRFTTPTTVTATSLSTKSFENTTPTKLTSVSTTFLSTESFDNSTWNFTTDGLDNSTTPDYVTYNHTFYTTESFDNSTWNFTTDEVDNSTTPEFVTYNHTFYTTESFDNSTWNYTTDELGNTTTTDFVTNNYTFYTTDSFDNETSNVTTDELGNRTTQEYVTGNDTLYTTETYENVTSNFTTDEIVTDFESSTVTPKTTTPDPRVCKNNPCKNGGTCTETSDGQKCFCPYPYTGNTCEDNYWCTEGLGKELCVSNNCIFNYTTGIGRCICAKNHFYNYDKKECQAVDKCPLMPGKCTKPNEICLNNDCHCKENFKGNDKGDCVPNFCETSKKGVCGENSICKENEVDPENVKCECVQDHLFNGKECVKVSKCLIPGVLECQQICNETTESCSCLPGYDLLEDGKRCSLNNNTHNCSKNCNPGFCYKDEGNETCLCPPSHVYRNGTCKDLCTAGSLPPDLCPKDSCEPHPTLGFRCKCEGEWTYDENNVTCRRKFMCSEGGGIEMCSNKSAKCVDDAVFGFTCECPESVEKDEDGVCKSKCELKKYQNACLHKLAECEMQASEAICKCPPLLTFDEEEICRELATSFTGVFPFARNKYVSEVLFAPGETSPVLDYNRMRHDLRNAMHLVYGKNYKFADILNCNETSLMCNVEIQFASDPKDQVKLVGELDTCISSESNTCFIPPELVLEKKSVNTELLSKTDPCMESIKQSKCGGKETTCTKSDDGRNFQCACADGFASYRTIYPVSDRRTVIHNCQDIDECQLQKACPNRTRCLNTFGSYDCSCVPGYRPVSASSDLKKVGCVDVCTPKLCGNGVCQLDGFYYTCRCNDGFSGDNCKQKAQPVEDSKGPKVALIVLSTMVIPLLLFAMYMVHKYRILVRKVQETTYIDDTSSTISMTPLRPGFSQEGAAI